MEKSSELERYYFRDLHPSVLIGTASDRYAGWIGQIYSEELYKDQISRRSKKVGGKSFVEKVLPVNSVREYFQHFRTLELDFTFYGLLLDKSGKPTPTFHVLRAYRSHLAKDAKLILKVPQIVSAKKLMRSGKMIGNGNYLNSKIFIEQFYEPAVELLDQWLDGLIFEQEYQRKEERSIPEEQAKNLDIFFENIPEDSRYHIELRTESFLSEPVFNVLDKYGVGQVLSHWTWLPSLKSQFGKSGGRFFNSSKHSIIRLMTPKGMRYEKAYAKAHPFNNLVDGMLNPQMVKQTVEIASSAVEEGSKISIVVNNRAGGNAPLIAVQVAKQFLTSMK